MQVKCPGCRCPAVQWTGVGERFMCWKCMIHFDAVLPAAGGCCDDADVPLSLPVAQGPSAKLPDQK